MKKEKYLKSRNILMENEDTKYQKYLLKKKEKEMDKIMMDNQRRLLQSQDETRNRILKDIKNKQIKIVEKGGKVIANRIDIERDKINLAGEEYERQKEQK